MWFLRHSKAFTPVQVGPPPDLAQMGHDVINWAGNQVYGAALVHAPGSVEELQELVARSSKCKALGTRHSFNLIADTDADHISTENLSCVLAIDKEARTVTVQAGVPYGRFCKQLDEAGFALHNLASLPHISVAGACATATHGSGVKNGNLATAVSALDMVKGAGELVSLSRKKDGDLFKGAVVNLGALGIVTSLTLDVNPTFQMSQMVYEGLPLAVLSNNIEEVMSLGYSVSLFTTWQESVFEQVWVKSVAGSVFPPEIHGAKPATQKLHPIPGASPVNCTDQLGIPGPWYERMPHFRMDFTPSSGDELQTEYLVPQEHIYEALCAVDKMREQIAPLLHISEVRAIAEDDLWMSPCYKQPCVGVHFTWKSMWDEVEALLPAIDHAFSPFQGRPHWGKLFDAPPERIRSLYPRRPDFEGLAREFDPEGKFKNDFLVRLGL